MGKAPTSKAAVWAVRVRLEESIDGGHVLLVFSVKEEKKVDWPPNSTSSIVVAQAETTREEAPLTKNGHSLIKSRALLLVFTGLKRDGSNFSSFFSLAVSEKKERKTVACNLVETAAWRSVAPRSTARRLFGAASSTAVGQIRQQWLPLFLQLLLSRWEKKK